MRILKKKILLSTTQTIVLSFVIAILAGALLLMMPFSSADGRMTPFLDSLFTATTAGCVTGLVTVTTAFHWNLFGKIVILILIQIGGLGVPAVMMLFVTIMGRKISLGSRKLLEDSFNLDTLSGLIVFLKRVALGTFLVEGIGALLCFPVFAKEYGIGRGLWYSVFHSISAFCNAGIDILGENSLMPYVNNYWFNLVTMLLIVLGGIGFIVWWDVINVCRKRKRYLSLHSKIVLIATAFLILFGAVLYLIFEFENPKTIGEFSFPQKVLACLFQSVTTRTAGFAAISQKALTTESVIITILLMFIGGSSVGTAGGVKTGTIAVLILTVFSTVKGYRDTIVFGKKISFHIIRKALAVVCISILASITALILMFLFVPGATTDVAFEVYSALGTAGLSRDFTAGMNTIGKIIICICMFLGRIGPMSMVMAFTMKSTPESVGYVEEEITVG